jgi:hypothetical protein
MNCPRCGRPASAESRFCGGCGAPLAVARAQGAADPALRYVLPIDRSGWAVAAGYLGLFSILLLPAPLALACGLKALADLRSRPGRLGRGRAWFGIVAGALGSLGLAAVLAAVALGD